MDRLKKISKILTVILLATVCVITCLIPASASSSVLSSSGSVYGTPYFAPTSLSFINGNYFDLMSLDLNVALSASQNANSDYGILDSSLSTSTSSDIVTNVLNINKVNNLTSQYGMSYYSGKYNGGMTYSRTGYVDLTIYFNDIYVPAGLNSQATYDWSRLGTFVLSGITCTSATLNVTYSYLSDKNGVVDYVSVDNIGIPITASEALDSSLWMSKIKDRCRSGLTWGDMRNGFYISSIKLKLNGCESYDSFSYSGDVRFSNSSGSQLALNAWSDYYVADQIISGGSSETVIESTIRGLNAVWNLELFGAFKVGTLFTACMCILLLRWFLKMFAGG